MFQSNLNNVLRALDAAEERALTAVGHFVRSEAQMRSPVGQYPSGSGRVGGNLRDSNDFKVDIPGKRVMVGDYAEYAEYVHEGTSRQKAQPWLEDSVMDNKARIQSIITQTVRL